jgi:ABC-type Zn uptake system ZnuABC Zn-binding protein ZnuA
MKKVQVLLLVMFSLTVLGCTSSKDRAYQAQEGVHKERLALIEKYQKCLDAAGGDNVKVEACDQYLKAAEALK